MGKFSRKIRRNQDIVTMTWQTEKGLKTVAATERVARSYLTLAKAKFEAENANIIYCVKKGNVYSMCHDRYDSVENMKLMVDGFRKIGYNVYYTEASGLGQSEKEIQNGEEK